MLRKSFKTSLFLDKRYR